MHLKAIQQRLTTLAVLSGLGLLVSSTLFVNNTLAFRIDKISFIVFILLISILFLTLFIREYKKFIYAKLIMDNKIIHIQAAEIEKKSKKHNLKAASTKNMDIFISCFGILLGSKVIKFNTQGISLKKIEISNDLIFITYGKEEAYEIIKLLHGVLNEKDLQNIIEQFRHETGIIPVIVNHQQ